MQMIKGDKVGKGEVLLRRVYRTDKRYIDKRTGRPTSRAFAPRPKDEGRLSVDIARLTTTDEAIYDKKKFCLFSIISDLVIELMLSCVYDPIENNISHSVIVGFDEEDESVPGILARSSIQIA